MIVSGMRDSKGECINRHLTHSEFLFMDVAKEGQFDTGDPRLS